MLKRLLPHLAAVGIFAILTVIYFKPYYSDMTLSQGDVTQWEGMSKEIVDWNKDHPNDPALWTGRMFGGMPAVQISMIFSGNFVTKIFHVIGVPFPGAAAYMFVMFLGFYILLLCLDVNPWLSIGGSLAYGLSTFILISIDAGHNTKVQAMSLMAPALGGVILAYRKNILVGAALTALFISMGIDSNHLQISYYLVLTMGMLGVYFFVESLLEKRIAHFVKATGALIVAGLIAVIPNVGNLWSTQEYAKETIRGGSSPLTSKQKATNGGLDFNYATSWSYGSLWNTSYKVREKAGPFEKQFSPSEYKDAEELLDSMNKKNPGGYELITNRSFDGEILSILIPDIKGGGGSNTLSDDDKAVQRFIDPRYSDEQKKGIKQQIANLLYWGNQPFTSGPAYFGAAIVFLFVFSLLIIRSNIRWVLLAITLFFILLALGHNTPFYSWMFAALPFFNKFRTPSMALAVSELIMPLTALLGLNEILNGKVSSDEILKKLKISAGIVAGIIIVFGIIGSYSYSFAGPNDAQVAGSNPELVNLLKEERGNMLRMDSFRSLFFIAAAFGLIWFFVQKKLSKTIFIAGISLVFLVDGWMEAKHYLNDDNFVENSQYQSHHSPTQADLDILKDPDTNFRVLNLTTNTFNDAMTSYYHKSIGGYHAAKLIRYQDLIENQISRNNINVLNMLNAKYVIVPNQKKEPVAQRNPGALGNAWCVREIKWVNNADEEMAALNNFDPQKEVVINSNEFKKMVPDNAIGVDTAPAIRELLYSPNKLTYAFNSSSSQLVVFSEVYYDDKKGWNAYLDGKPVDHFRVNYTLRGMVVPAGTHNIEFKFEPKSIVEGNKIAYAGSFLLFAFVFGTLGFAGYKKKKEIDAEPKEEVKPTPAPATKPTKKK